MKNIGILLIFLHIPVSLANIDLELSPFYYDFLKLIPKSCKFEGLQDIKFSILKKTVLGECTQYLSHSKIEINSVYWEVLTDSQKKQLMYHELSHCILDINHSLDKNNYMTSEGFPKLSDTDLENQVIANIIEYCSEH